MREGMSRMLLKDWGRCIPRTHVGLGETEDTCDLTWEVSGERAGEKITWWSGDPHVDKGWAQWESCGLRFSALGRLKGLSRFLLCCSECSAGFLSLPAPHACHPPAPAVPQTALAVPPWSCLHSPLSLSLQVTSPKDKRLRGSHVVGLHP